MRNLVGCWLQYVKSRWLDRNKQRTTKIIIVFVLSIKSSSTPNRHRNFSEFERLSFNWLIKLSNGEPTSVSWENNFKRKIMNKFIRTRRSLEKRKKKTRLMSLWKKKLQNISLVHFAESKTRKYDSDLRRDSNFVCFLFFLFAFSLSFLNMRFDLDHF